jgi:hypothetical protein
MRLYTKLFSENANNKSGYLYSKKSNYYSHIGYSISAILYFVYLLFIEITIFFYILHDRVKVYVFSYYQCMNKPVELNPLSYEEVTVRKEILFSRESRSGEKLQEFINLLESFSWKNYCKNLGYMKMKRRCRPATSFLSESIVFFSAP